MQQKISFYLVCQRFQRKSVYLYMQQKWSALSWTVLGLLVILGCFFLEKHHFQLPGGIHETADDASYLRPAENLVDHGIWKDNSEGPSAYVQRPPIVGLLYAPGYWIAPHQASIIFFVIAVIVHAFSIRCLYFLLSATDNRWRSAGMLLYTVLPCFSGFLSYSISEALVVSVTVIGITLFYLNRSGFILGSFLLFIYLFRPVLLLLFLPWFLIRLRERLHVVGRTWKLVFLSLLLITLGWEARKAYYTGHLLDPHPIYHEANQTVYRPPHEKLSNLFRVWESKPELFHELCGKALENQLHETNVVDYCRERTAPIDARLLTHLLKQWAAINQKALEERALTLTSGEINLIRDLKRIRKELVANYPWRYYVYTPLQGMKEQLPKSHLNLGIFQETYRGNLLVELLRTLCLGLVLLCFVLVPASIFYKHPLRPMAIGIVLYFLYLFWVQRMNEDRYLLPAFVTAFCCLFFWGNALVKSRRKPH